MKKLFACILLGGLFLGCSSDDDSTNGNQDDTLLTISRGPNSNFRTDGVKDFTIEVIVTSHDGKILDRDYIEPDQTIILTSEYDKSKRYDLHFVKRYINFNPHIEFSFENVLTYEVRTFLDVEDRTYFYDLDIDYFASNPLNSKANLEVVNLPPAELDYDIITKRKNGYAVSISNGFILANKNEFSEEISVNGETVMYATFENKESGFEELRYAKQGVNTGQNIILDYNKLPFAQLREISFPGLFISDSFINITNYSISGFDSSNYNRFFSFKWGRYSKLVETPSEKFYRGQ